MLSRIKARFAVGEGTGASADERLANLVARQRGLRAAAVQERLSHQQTDPHSEQPTEALYAASVYVSSEVDLEPDAEG